MPAKYNLLPKTTFSNAADLESVIALLLVHSKISRTQYVSILQLCVNSYPATLEIEQRMPKQVLYLTLNHQKYTINNRAKICIKV